MRMTSVVYTVPQSTYRTNYRGEIPTLPLIKYKTLPCLYPPGETEPCRPGCHVSVPLREGKRLIPQPPSAGHLRRKRPTSSRLKPIAVNLPTKPINKVYQTKFGPMDTARINQLVKSLRYTTFTQKAGSEFALPVHKPVPPSSTQEPRPDMVRFRSQRYEPRPEEWQQAVLWDRLQTRGHPLRPATPTEQKLLCRRSAGTTSLLQPDTHAEILELVRSDGLASVFERKCPGYAGYRPMCPPDTRLDDKKTSVDKMSLMAASYTKLPSKDYHPQQYVRKGPLSRTVTLTYPLNPFNKVGQTITRYDKERKYAGFCDSLQIMTA